MINILKGCSTFKCGTPETPLLLTYSKLTIVDGTTWNIPVLQLTSVFY